MARQELNNGDSGLLVRTKINQQFTELYGENIFSSLSESVLTPNLNLFSKFLLNNQDEDIDIQNPTGSTIEMAVFFIRIKFGSTVRNINWGDMYVGYGSQLIDTSIPNKTVYFKCYRNEFSDTFDVMTIEQF